MNLLARFLSRLKWIAKRRRLEMEMEDEVRFHLESHVDELVQRGVPAAEAKRRARLEFGGIESHKDAMRASVGVRGWDEMWADLRFGTRMLLKNPGFTAIAVASLTLGIGANTAIFAVARRVLLDTLAVKNPGELRLLTWVSGHERPVPPVWGDVSSTEGGGLVSTAFSFPVLEEMRKRTEVFQDLIAFKDVEGMTATVDGHPDIVTAEMVSGNAFDALGVQPILGRPLTPADDNGPGKGPVTVIGEGYWEERFGGSSSVLGKSISINGVPITVVGVIPARFAGLTMGSVAQIFVPLTMQPFLIPRAQVIASGNSSLLGNPQSWWVSVIARLRPDAPEAKAQAVLDAVLRHATLTTLSTVKDFDRFHLKLETGNRGQDYLQAQANQSYLLLTLAGLILLLACVNLANLLLARATARQREIGTRLALGAGRARIVRQLLTESLMLSILGGALGLVLSFSGRHLIPLLFENTGQLGALRPEFDWLTLAFTMAVSLAAAIVFGTLPAWQATRAAVNTALIDGSYATPSQNKLWMGKGLVVVQITLSTILLIGAGGFVRTLINLSHRPLGFQADHMLLFRLNPPRSRYSDVQMQSLYGQLEEKLAAIPGVRSATMSNIAIIGDGHSGSTFHVSGREIGPDDEERIQTNAVGADFFHTMGMAVLEGRGFSAHDTAISTKVAVVNQALVRRFFPKQDPIGQTFTCDSEDGAGQIQIVGVVADTRYLHLRSDTPATFYVPYVQRPLASRMVFELRTVGESSSIVSEVRAAVESMDRDLPLSDVRTMTEQIETTVSGERMFAQLTSAFGALALMLASVGIYGIMAYTVARRMNEIGIRMALGAPTRKVLLMILREASALAVIGISAGLSAGLLLMRFIRSMLFGLNPTDPFTLASAALLLLAIALLAGWGPARRASLIQPIQALNRE